MLPFCMSVKPYMFVCMCIDSFALNTHTHTHTQHGETALHLIAKYNHANVIAPFAAFKVNMDIRGKVYPVHILLCIVYVLLGKIHAFLGTAATFNSLQLHML